MTVVGRVVLAWGAAYLLGSLPAGLIWGWLTRGIDVRRHGSGRTGGTNVWRSAGFAAAVLTVVSDVLKGIGAIAVGRALSLGGWSLATAGTLAVVGHNYSIFMKLRGGAGTGTALGVCAGLWFWGLPFVGIAGAAAGLLVGHASVTSILVALLLPLAFCLRGEPAYAVGFGLPTMALTLWALRPNIGRLLRREERFLPIYQRRPPMIRICHYPPVSDGG